MPIGGIITLIALGITLLGVLPLLAWLELRKYKGQILDKKTGVRIQIKGQPYDIEQHQLDLMLHAIWEVLYFRYGTPITKKGFKNLSVWVYPPHVTELMPSKWPGENFNGYTFFSNKVFIFWSRPIIKVRYMPADGTTEAEGKEMLTAARDATRHEFAWHLVPRILSDMPGTPGTPYTHDSNGNAIKPEWKEWCDQLEKDFSTEFEMLGGKV